MENSSERMTGIAAIKDFIAELARDMKSPRNSRREKIIGIIIMPVLVPVTILLIVLGFEKEDASWKGLMATMLVFWTIVIFVIVEFGPGLLARANALVNG